MMNSAARTLGLLLCSLALVACGSSARFQVTRPALLDASPFGNSFSVMPFGGGYPSASIQVQRDLQQRIANSLNPSITLQGQGGGIVIAGEVLANDYGEQLTENRRTCTRSVSYRDSSGQQRTRSESYACTTYTRTGTARVMIRFVVQVASTGQWVYDRTFDDSRSASTSATNQMPGGIDGGGMLADLNARIVADFARVILPWSETVVVRFTGCGGADRCGEAIDYVHASQLFEAERIYTEILGPYDSPDQQVTEEDLDIVSETLYNRGVVRAYSGSYELALQDLQRAIQLRPDHDEWNDMLQEVERTAEEGDRLRQQIEGTAPPLQGYQAVQP